MRPLTIALTGLNNHDNPGPGIPVARALKESHRDIRIIGLSYESSEPGIYMDEHLDAVYMIPYPGSGSESLLHRLYEIHAIEMIDVLIPNFDAELALFIRLQPDLQKLGIRLSLPSADQLEERTKSKLSEFGDKYDILVPATQTIFGPEEIHRFAQEHGYPLVVKGQFYEAQVVHHYEQAVKAFHEIAGMWGTPIILQAFIEGTEINLATTGDGKGNCLGMISMRKLYITDKGKAWSGVVIQDNGLEEQAESLIRQTNWNGPLELEIIKSKEKGEYYLVEINPRFPAWIYLSVGAGVNLPDIHLSHLLNQPTQAPQKPKVGTMFIRYSYDLICDRDRFEQIASKGTLNIKNLRIP